MSRRATASLITAALLVTPLFAGGALAAPEPRGQAAAANASASHAGEKRPAFVPAAPDALSRALETTAISPARYALERARSLFSLGQVRARFGRVAAPDSRAATMLLRDLALRLDDLGPAERAAAERILARPTGPPSDPDKYSVPEATPFCSTNVCVHYVASTGDAPPLVDVSGVVGVPDYVETTSSVMEEVWAFEVDGLNYKAPKSDLTSPNHGPDGKLDIYLAEIGDDGLFGYCTSDDPHLMTNYRYWDMSAYCVLDNDYDPIQFHMPSMDALQVTAAHEFFHAVQFHYDIGEDIWFMEGTATWIEDEVYDDVNDNLRYLPSSPIGQPTVPLDRNTGFRIYGTWIFWRFLAEYFGGAIPANGIVRATWNRADGSPGGPDRYSTQAAAQAIAARTVNGTPWKLRWAFADFGVWNSRPARFYDEGASYPTAPVAQSRTLTRTAPSFLSNTTLDHLTNRSVVLHRGGNLSATAKLKVVVDGPNYGTGPEASVLVIRTTGASSVRTVSLNANGNGNVTVAFGSAIARVIVIMTNGSARYVSCYSGQTAYACFGGVPLDQNRPYSFRATVV